MTQDKPETRDWLKDLAAVSAQLKKKPQPLLAKIGKTLNLHRPTVSVLAAIEPIFDPPTVKKVLQAASGNHPYTFSFSSAKELVRLNGRVEDYPKTGRELVEQILAEHLATGQINARVTQITGVQPAKKQAEGDEPNTTHPSPSGDTLGRRMGDALANFIDSFAEADSPMESAHPNREPRHVASAQGPQAHSAGQAVSTTETAQPSQGSRLGGGTQAKHHVWKTLWKFVWKIITWIPRQIVHLIKFLVGGFFNIIGKIFGKPVKTIVQTAFFLLLVYGIFWAFTHPGRVLGWGKGLVVRAFDTAIGWNHSNPPSAQTEPMKVAAIPAPQAVVNAPVSPPKAVKHSRTSSTDAVQPASTPSTKAVTRPGLTDSQAVEAKFALGFIQALYGMNYQDVEGQMRTLQGLVSGDYYKDFNDQFLDRDRIENLKYFKRIETFTPDQPVLFGFSDANKDEFVVEGTWTIRRDENPPKLEQEKPVTILTDVAHDLAGRPVVVGVIDLSSK